MLTPAEVLVAPPPFDRTRGVGGTDASAIMNLYPWRTPEDVWMEKTHHPMWAPQAENEAMRWGKVLEPVVRGAYEGKQRCHVLPGPPFDAEPMWHPNGIQYYHADGWVLDDTGNAVGLFEAKTSSNPDAWVDGVPDYYQVQVQQGMAITEMPWCDVAVLIGGSDFRVYRIEADPLLQMDIQTRAEEFWTDVLTGQWSGDLPTILRYPVANPETGIIQADDDLNAAALTLLEIKRRSKDLTGSAEKVVANIQAMLKDAPGADGKGWYIIWKETKPPTTTDWESVAVSLWNALESIRRDMRYGTERQEPMPDKVAAMLDPKLYPTLISLYTQTGKATRPFLLKEGVRK